MQEANNIYFGSLEAAARFGGRLGLRQQARLSEDQGPSISSVEEQLESMAEPKQSTSAISATQNELTQWGRCGFVTRSEIC